MISDEKALQLHEKATRGKKLSKEEQAQLQSWYQKQDDTEHKLLHAKANNNTTPSLANKIRDALDEIARLTNRIQEISTENEELRRENATLRSQIAVRTKQPA